MKTLILMFAVSLMSVTAYSQNSESILNQYLKVKEALIKTDNKASNEHALSLQKTIETTDSFGEKESLSKAVQKMIKATDIEKQRIAFADVSVIMWKMVKNNSEIKDAIYYQYCPMKKMYWLSKEDAIKNPYYGSKMLTCGNVSDKKVK